MELSDKFKITLTIDSDKYLMEVPRKDEQLYRDAAREVSIRMNKYRASYGSLTDAKIWGMVAFEFAYNLQVARSKADASPYINSMTELTQVIENAIHPESQNDTPDTNEK